MTIALARRYRPKRFSDLLVQDHVAAALRGAVARGRVGHGYLLTGPRGVGKTTAARILAMALNCDRRAEAEGEPCGECESCRRVWTGSANLDVVEIDAASNRGVDDARDLRERAMYAASREGNHKVYIVDEAHMLTREAWNALLKILEEPPPRVVFVFATTEPQKIASTAAPVMSRLQRFDFRRIGPNAIRQRLREVVTAEGLTVDDDALTLIGRAADGGMRDALSLLDQCLSFGEGDLTADRVRDVLGLIHDEVYADLLELVAERRPADVFPLVDRVMEAGADLGEFLTGAAELWRALLMLQVGAEPEGLTEATRQLLERYRDRLQAGDLLRMLKLLADQEEGVRKSLSPRILVETLLLRWAMLDRVVDLAEVLAGGGGGGGGSGSGPGPAASEGSPGRRAPSAAERPSPRNAAPEPEPEPRPPAPERPVPFTLEALREAWPVVVDRAREQSRFLAGALQGIRPVAVEGGVLTLEITSEAPMGREALERQQRPLEELLGGLTAQAVRIAVREAQGTPAAAPARPVRTTEASIKAERLEAGRASDPALDAAANALDLEVLE